MTMTGFIKIRRGIEEHLIAGTIGFFETGIYVAMHLQADFRTGVWVGSAPRLAATAPRGASLRDIQRAMERLAEIRFIRVFHTPGSRGNYRVLLHKFEPQTPALKGKRLNAFKSENWRDLVFETCAEGDAEGVAEDAPYLRSKKEKEKEKALCAPSERPTKRATPFLDGFELDAGMLLFANENGVNPHGEFAAFRDHHKSKGNVFRDWKAAWRTWVRNAVKFNGGKRIEQPANGPKSFDESRREANKDSERRISERMQQNAHHPGRSLPPSVVGGRTPNLPQRIVRSPDSAPRNGGD